jgi:hypothetical protein
VRLGTAEARQVLNKLSAGAPSRETRDAKAALAGLEKRVADQRWMPLAAG